MTRGVVGLAPKSSAKGGRPVVGLAPTQKTGGRPVVGLAGQQQKKKHGGSGILGALGSAGHFAASKAEIAARDIKGAPIGLVHQANTAIVQPWKDVLTSGHVSAKTNRNIDKLVQDTADQTVQTLNHPLRDPFATLLLVNPALHGVGRAGTSTARAGGALARGEGVKAAAKAAVDRTAKPRTLKVGKTEVSLVASKNPAARAGQAAYDKLLQRGLDQKPQGRVAAHAQKRVGGALNEQARIEQKMRAVPANLLDKAAGKLSKRVGARREEQAALELTSVNTAPEAAAAYHFKQAAAGVNSKQNLHVGRLYQRVHERGILTKDERGNVVVNAEAHPRLAQADARLAELQRRGDKVLVDKGVRSAETLRARVDAPGRVRAGATYVKTAAVKPRAEQVREYPGRSKTVTRDLALGEAKAKLATLNDQYDKLVQRLVPETSPFGAGGSAARKSEQLRRNFENSRAGKGKFVGTSKKQTVTAEEYRIAEAKLHDVVERNPESVAAKRIASLISERERLQGALNARSESAFAGEMAPSLGKVSETIPGKPRRVHLREQQAQKATSGFVGGETAAPGRGFVSARPSEKKLSKAEASASRGPVVGAVRSPIDAKTFTGRSIEQGLIPKHVTASASRHFRQILKFVNTDAHRRRALETGSDVRRSNRDVLVRNPDVTPEKLTASVQQALGRETTNVDTAEELATQEGLRAAHQAYLEHVVPGLRDKFSADRQAGVGAAAPEGYRWVDRGALGDLAGTPAGSRGKVARSVDTVNSAVTAATVYFKVGHVGTRVLTNAATNIIQGSATPLQMKKSWQLWHDLDDEQRARSLAAAGQHGFASLPHEGQNVVAVVAGKGAKWWAKHADAMFRFNSLAYEARKAGYGAPTRFVSFLDHLESGGQGLPAHEWAKVSAAARRADREAIAYDRLNEFEKRYITRAVWFYPWIKGSTMFTVRTAIEHPYKAAYLAQSGQQGRNLQEQLLGPTPSYEAGLMALGGGARPLTTDFSTFSPFATAADVIEAPGQPGALAGFANPAVGAAGQFVYGLNQYGGPSQSPYKDALLALGSATPEQQLAEAYAAQGQDQSNRIFHKSVLSALERYVGGPATPRRANKNALAAAAARQKSGRR